MQPHCVCIWRVHTYAYSTCPVTHCAHTCFLQTTCASSHVGLKEKDVVVTSRSPEAAAPAETAHPEATPEGSAQRTHWQYNCEHSENYTSSQKDYYSRLWARTDTAVRCVVSSSSRGHTSPIMFHSPVTEIWSKGFMHLQHYSKVPHLMVMVVLDPCRHVEDRVRVRGTQLTWFE